MGLFTFWHSERESEIERALQGVPFSGDITFSYNGQGKEKDKEIISPVYLLPVDAHNNDIYGYFKLEGKLAEVPIGFLQRKEFLFKEYFRPNLEGRLVKQNRPNDGTIYLPLKLTDLLLTLGTVEKGNFVPYNGSPFSLLGVEGPQGLYPLILISETEEIISCKGFYKTKNGEILAYEHQKMRPADKPIRDFLRMLRSVKPKALEKKEIAENTLISTGKATDGEINWEEPKTIVIYLDQYVVGQEDAKRVIAVAFSNYMTKVRMQNDELHKENMLLIGPSGVGKTYMVSLLARKASLPMVQTKLTGKSSEGYIGENLSTVFEQMRAMTAGETPYGIIFFDEIDKLARDTWGSGNGFGSRLQDELIGYLEETTVLADRKGDKKVYGELNTKNLFFITAGTFQGLNEDLSLAEIIRKRLVKGQKQIGFALRYEETKDQSEEYMLPKVRPMDLITYGLKPELVGRLPSIGVLRPLTLEDKVRILTKAKRSTLTSYLQLLQLKGYNIILDDAVPEIIAKHCPEEIGARALSALCNNLFTEILFDPKCYADDKKVIRITPDLARKLINLYIS